MGSTSRRLRPSNAFNSEAKDQAFAYASHEERLDTEGIARSNDTVRRGEDKRKHSVELLDPL